MVEVEEFAEEVALAHAVLRWEAETENASRLAGRENGILTVIATVLALGLLRAGDLRPREPWGVYCILLALSVFALISLLLALAKVLWVRFSREGKNNERATTANRPADEEKPFLYASEHLAWPRAPELHPSELPSSREAFRIAYKATTKAANSLNGRNVKTKERLDSGQRWLFVAALFGGVSILAYSFTGPPETEASETLSPKSEEAHDLSRHSQGAGEGESGEGR